MSLNNMLSVLGIRKLPAVDENTVLNLEDNCAHALDVIELGVGKARKILRPYKGLIMFGVGFICTFYGKNFTYSILFVQAFRAGGWSQIKKAMDDLRETYNRSRIVLKEELPHVLEAKDALLRLKPELDALEAEYKAALDAGDQHKAARILKKCEALQAELGTAMQATSSITAITKSIDPTKIGDIFGGIYNGVLACLATAMSGGAAKVGIGVNLGNMLSDAADKVLKPFIMRQLGEVVVADPHTQKWIDFGLSSLCSSIGIGLAFYADQLIYTVSNAMVGSEIMIHQVALLLNDHGMHLEGSPAASAIQWALVGSGVSRQLVLRKSDLPGVIKVFAWPILLCESSLRGMAGVIRASGGGLVH